MCRVISYNIHSGVGRDKKQDYKRIGEFLAEQRADIVLLQEMDTRPAHRSVDEDIQDICANNAYQLIASPALFEESGWYGNAVLSRFDVISHNTFKIGEPNRQPRNIQMVELLTDQGPLTVVNTHFGLKRWERRKQLSTLVSHVERQLHANQIPLLLAGDFNEWQLGSGLFKPLNKLLNQQSFGATFPSTFPLFALDRAWLTSELTVLQARKINNQHTKNLSDHLPVLIDIELPS
jgi:endonuclease/exonuclease/phosphatase family metal-dependent hydrolase